MWEENEPNYIEQDPASEKNSISSCKALTITLDRNEREHRNHQIDQQNSIVKCSKRSDQSTPYLKFKKTKTKKKNQIPRFKIGKTKKGGVETETLILDSSEGKREIENPNWRGNRNSLGCK